MLIDAGSSRPRQTEPVRPRRSKEPPVSTTDTAIDPQALAVGGRIRQLRRARGLTLVQLAAVAELSHPFLSQLERGLARPSMVSLGRIAQALGSSQVELLAAADDAVEPAAQPIGLVRNDEGSTGPYGQAGARLLVHGARRFTPMEIRGTDLVPDAFFTHAEDEFVHVVEGALVVELGDDEPRVLEVGDSLYYVGGTPHRWHALDDRGYRLFVVKEHAAVR
ncbi:helix-turn-helix domain-containing protein [Frigoribacterium sp. 2-23]|uniref:helix-turn-helix domain-containing protein n=1 Tax=Frigoribacterium sp. 2-23 TaxID=3415006 RepID=UPI003C704526